MDTPYERLDGDTREAWRDNPTTIAFIATVQMHYTRLCEGLVNGAMGGGTVPLESLGGELRGLRFVLDLPAKGKKE